MANRLDELEIPRGPGFLSSDDNHNGFRPDGLPQDAEGTVSPDSEEPESPGTLGRRFFRPQTLISFVIAGFIVLFFFQRLEINYGEIWSNIRQANLAVYALAFIPFYGSFYLRAYPLALNARSRWHLRRAWVSCPQDQWNGRDLPTLLVRKLHSSREAW